MSFTDRYSSILIGTGAVIDGSGNPAADEIYNPSDEGWDGLEIHYVHRVAELTPEACAAAYPQGAQLGARKFWITSAKPVRKAHGLWFAEVSFKGWAATKPAKISVGAAAELQRGENILTPDGLFAKVSVTENTPTMRVTYLVEDYADAPTDDVGRPVTPPDAVAVASTIWATLVDATYHFPNGWVLMGSSPDRLPGTTAALVHDDYKFIRSYSP